MQIIRAKKISLSLDLAPLIDVVFQLLVFFMLTSSFAHPMMKLNLPKAVTHDVHEPERVVIAVDRAGSVLLNDQPTTLTQLEVDLRNIFSKTHHRSVHIQGDQQMPYQHFVDVMDRSRKAGAKQINIIHQKKE